jgi:multidrug efflux pump
MPAFFIDRPIFAWVVALFICLIGLIAIPFLAIAQYPIIAPPSISISTSYPGSSPEELYNSTTRLIEEELNGASGILNFDPPPIRSARWRSSPILFPARIPISRGRNSKPHQARRGASAASCDPAGYPCRGSVQRGASDHHAEIHRRQLDEVGLGDFMIRNVLGEIRRIPGVGRATCIRPSARCASGSIRSSWSATTSPPTT